MDTLRDLAIAAAMLSTVATAEAKEVRMFPFSFELPDAWYVEAGSSERTKVYASGGSEMYHPPFILAETCVSTKAKDCGKDVRSPFPYDPSTQKEAYEENYRTLGCTGSAVIAIPRDSGVVEKRLICSSVGYSLFITERAVLWVAYAPLEKNIGIAEFLDSIARSLKVR